MKVLAAIGVGWYLGSRAAPGELDEVGRALKAILESDELQELVDVVRRQATTALRDMASMLETGWPAVTGGGDDDGGGGGDVAPLREVAPLRDVVERARRLAGLA